MIMRTTNETQELALQTFTKLIRAAETATAAAHRSLPGQGLTISQFGVLEALFHLGPMCQKDLAGKILKSTGNITQVIDNLERRRLVERRRNNEDRRYYSIHLTTEGEKLISALFPEHAEKITRVMATLNEEEQNLLGNLCRKFKNIDPQVQK